MLILFLILFLILTLLVYKYSKNYLSPIVLLNYIWIFFIIIALILYPNYNWNYWGLLYILMINFSSFICYQIVFSKKNKRKKNKKKKINKKLAKKIILFSIFIGLIKSLEELRLNNQNIYILLDFNNLLKFNNEVAILRYSGEGKNNIIMSISSIFIYCIPLFLGYIINFLKNKKFLIGISFIPILINMSLNNGKIGLIASLFLLISGYNAGYYEKNNKLLKLKKKYIKNIILVLLLVFLILYINMFFRVGKFDKNLISIMNDKFKKYSLGHIVSFDNWFKNKKIEYTLGSETFKAIYSLLFKVERIQGAYKLIKGSDSNVFTGYRGVINDYGIFGTFIFYCYLGLFTGVLYLKTNKKYENLKTTFIAGIYFFTMYSIVISPWFYTTYILVFIMFYFFITCVKR